jgi:hypothetical protein
MNHKHETLWPLKKCMLYILCTLILSNPFYLTIGLTLIKCAMSSKMLSCTFYSFFFLCLGFSMPSRFQFIAYLSYLLYMHHFFGWKVMKNGSPILCFHPFVFNFLFNSFNPFFIFKYFLDGYIGGIILMVTMIWWSISSFSSNFFESSSNNMHVNVSRTLF